MGELSTRSEEFRRRWAAHNVRMHTTGVKLLHHPVVGDLDLPFETFPLPHDPSSCSSPTPPSPTHPRRTP
ncbi:MmyB family transcriptional regulator [Streptomyces canus]|uniref:MmyB family transcriptional regulator n=1 Tax=Streptomyces canus TaxID=58343 RepID=UPI00359339FE